jgi:hypothetical protein
MAATITYRRLDANWDPMCGAGQNNFVTDIDAVAQAIATRIKLLSGEWWANLNAGMPLLQQMLGAPGSSKHLDTVALLIKQRIEGTPFVLGVSSIATAWDSTSRAFSFSCNVSTQFGTLSVSTGNS